MSVGLNSNCFYQKLLPMIVVAAMLFLYGCNKHKDAAISDSVSVNKEFQQTGADRKGDFDTVSIALFPAEDALPMLYANEWGVMDSLGIIANLFIYRSQMDVEQAVVHGKADLGMSDMFRTVWQQSKMQPLSWLFSTRRRLFLVPNKALRLTNVSQLSDHMVTSSRFSMDDYFLSLALAGNTQKKKADGTLSSAPIHVQINSMPLRLSMLLSHQVDAAVLNTFLAPRAIDKGYKPLSIKTKISEGFGGYACNSRWAADHVKQLRRIVQAYDIAARRLASKDSLPSLSNAPSVLLPIKGKSFDAGRISHASVSEVLNWMRAQNAICSVYHPDTLIINLP